MQPHGTFHGLLYHYFVVLRGTIQADGEPIRKVNAVMLLVTT